MKTKAEEIALDKMYKNDAFSQWLGLEIKEISDGYCKVEMQVRKEMTNGFEIAHGGITFSLADSAFAFASNSRGKHAVSIETAVSHTKPVFVGDILTATAKELNLTNKIGLYTVEVLNQMGHLVAHFKGTVYRMSKEWEV
jgi:acyl-CoA thioesterase